MTEAEYKVALIGVLGHIGDGLHRIADAWHDENQAAAEDQGLPVDHAVDLSGRPIR